MKCIKISTSKISAFRALILICFAFISRILLHLAEALAKADTDNYLSGPNIAVWLKRHSPMLPTEGGCNIECLAEALAEADPPPFHYGETLNAAAAYGRHHWRTTLH
jgi:hypothetical protein